MVRLLLSRNNLAASHQFQLLEFQFSNSEKESVHVDCENEVSKLDCSSNFNVSDNQPSYLLLLISFSGQK